MFTPTYSTLQPYCSAQCTYNEKRRKDALKPPKKRKPIKKVSDKRKVQQPVYQAKRIAFLKQPGNGTCKIIGGTDCTKKATTIEHTKGRQGYADYWARERGITLYLDERFWLPACLNCNLELENNSELSKANQLSKIHDGKKI